MCPTHKASSSPIPPQDGTTFLTNTNDDVVCNRNLITITWFHHLVVFSLDPGFCYGNAQTVLRRKILAHSIPGRKGCTHHCPEYWNTRWCENTPAPNVTFSLFTILVPQQIWKLCHGNSLRAKELLRIFD